ncbi:hypothetical protein [Vibrio sp. Y2-5]
MFVLTVTHRQRQAQTEYQLQFLHPMR